MYSWFNTISTFLVNFFQTCSSIFNSSFSVGTLTFSFSSIVTGSFFVLLGWLLVKKLLL